MTDTKSPAPIDNPKVEDTGEPVAWRYTWKHTALDWEYSDRALIPHSGMIVQPLYAAPTAPTTGSEPWQVGDDTSSVQISRDGSTHKWGCKCEGCAPTTGSAPEINQCDGCRVNAPLTERYGNHAMPDGGFMACTKDRYAAPAAGVLTDDQIGNLAYEILGAKAFSFPLFKFARALLAASMGGDRK